jgi:uncharacterized phage protein gp47/JayE
LPWQTPTLKDVRSLVRDNVRASLPGADASVPNSVLRVLSDAQGGLCHLTLQYIDWLALQLLPDTAETEWLDRHGDIWLVNADGSKGRKQATFAHGMVSFTGVVGTVVPAGTQLTGAVVGYETTADATIGTVATDAPARALDPGAAGNMEPGDPLTLLSAVPGADGPVNVVEMTGGTDTENDDDLRARVLQRIQNPPMGGDQADYVAWTLAVPGVTRAWAASEMGIGTITVRFLMDDLRAADDGWPNQQDVATVQAYVDQKRPVTTKDCFVLAPIKEFIDVEIANLVPSTTDVAGAIEASIREMLHKLAAPGQTIYAAWISYAIMNAPGVQSFNLITNADYVMPSLGHMAVLETILYDTPPSAPNA